MSLYVRFRLVGLSGEKAYFMQISSSICFAMSAFEAGPAQD